MLNKIYEWIETSFANLRNGVPAAEHSDVHRPPGEDQKRRKRPIEWYELQQQYLPCVMTVSFKKTHVSVEPHPVRV